MWDTRELALPTVCFFLTENACWWEGTGRSWAALETEIQRGLGKKEPGVRL